MRFITSIAALVASAALSSAASVTFWALDEVTRTVYFTPSPGSPDIAPVVVPGGQKQVVPFPDEYVGNFYAVKDGAENKPGMLGEITFSGWIGLTYFDVSAIVDPTDKDNVKQMWPANIHTPMSGCVEFPCDNAYWHAADHQTKATTESDIICSLGTGSTGITFE